MIPLVGLQFQGIPTKVLLTIRSQRCLFRSALCHFVHARKSNNVWALTMLPAVRRRRLEAALVPPGVIAEASSTSDLIRRITARRGDLLVVDPEIIGTEMRVPDTVRITRIPALLYIRVSTEAAAAAITFVRRAPADIVVLGCGDDVETLTEQCVRTSVLPCVIALLDSLETTLVGFRPVVREGIEYIALGGSTFLSVDRLAAQCALSRFELTRTLQEGGIVSAKRLIDAFTVARHYGVLTSSTASCTQVAHAFGCASLRALDRKCLRLIGLQAKDLRRGLPLDAFVARLRDTVLIEPQVSGSMGP